MNMQEQWRVVFYEVDQEPIEEIVSSFHDAYALSLPDPVYEARWASMRKADVIAAFAAGATEVVVARRPGGVGMGRTVIQRV